MGFKLTPIFYRAEQSGCRGLGKRVAVHRTPLKPTKAVAAAAASNGRAVGSFLSVLPLGHICTGSRCSLPPRLT